MKKKNTYGGCFWRWAWQNQTTGHDIRIEQMLSLSGRFELFWQPIEMGM